MQDDCKPLQWRVDKLYKLGAQRVHPRNRGDSGNLIFADVLAAEDASRKRQVLAELLDEDCYLARGRKLILAVGKPYLTIEYRSFPRVLGGIKRAAQERLLCDRVADPEPAKCFAHLVLLGDGEPLKVGKDQRLGRLDNVAHLRDDLLFFLPCNGHIDRKSVV